MHIVLHVFYLIFGRSESQNAEFWPAGYPALLSINILGPQVPRATFTCDLERGPALDLPKGSGAPDSNFQLPDSDF